MIGVLVIILLKMKAKGSNAERDLIHLFWQNNYAALRIAGSGRMNYPSPDILASNGERTIAIECKATKKSQQYFDKEQIDQLIQFSKMFRAEPLIAIKFSANWHFFNLEDLNSTPSGKFVIKKGAESKEFSMIL